jgi:hypothetical protein
VSRPIIHSLDGVRVWQVQKDLYWPLVKALDYHPSRWHDRLGVFVFYSSIGSALGIAASALIMQTVALPYLLIAAIIIGVVGASIGMQLTELPKKRLRVRAAIKRGAVPSYFVPENDFIFEAIMVAELQQWLLANDENEEQKEEVRQTLERYHAEARVDSMVFASPFMPLSEEIQASFQVAARIIATAESFAHELTSLTGVTFGDHFGKLRREAIRQREIALRALIVRTDKSMEHAKQLLHGS